MPHPPSGHTQADEDAAVLHYYFGALGGDALSRMALGYRHMQGLGTPESCPASVAYYQPVAELVRAGRVRVGVWVGSN